MRKCKTISEHFSMTIPQMEKALLALHDNNGEVLLNIRGMELCLKLKNNKSSWSLSYHPYDGEGARLSDYHGKKKKYC